MDELEQHLKDGDVGLVSVQIANNEVGTIQPVAEVAALCRKYGALFHCDAVQGLGKIPVDVDDVGADMMSFSAHKIHGPKGIGALYVRRGTRLEPLVHGGGQESGMRSGTVPVHQAVGFGKAVDMAVVSLKKDMPMIGRIVSQAQADLEQRLGARVNGSRSRRLPNILSVTVPGMEGGVACGILCSKYGVCVSSGSACSSARHGGSHVLRAMGRGDDASSTLRLSLSRFTSESDLKLALSRLEAVAVEARKRSLL